MNNMGNEFLNLLGSLDSRTIMELKHLADSTKKQEVGNSNRLDIVVHNDGTMSQSEVKSETSYDKLMEMYNQLFGMMQDMKHELDQRQSSSQVQSALDRLQSNLDAQSDKVSQAVTSASNDKYAALEVRYHELENKLHDAIDAKEVAENKYGAAKHQIIDMGADLEAKDAEIEKLKTNDGSVKLEKQVHELEVQNEELSKDMADKDAALVESDEMRQLIDAYHEFVLALFKLLPADGTNIVRGMETIKALPDDVKSAQIGSDDVRFERKHVDDGKTLQDKKASDDAYIKGLISDDDVDKLDGTVVGEVDEGKSKSEQSDETPVEEDHEETEVPQAPEVNDEVEINTEENSSFD